MTLRIAFNYGLAAIAASLLASPADATLTVSAGIETTTGKYGKPTSTDETRIPLRATWASGPWKLRADVPLSQRVEGIATALDREEEEEEEGPARPGAPTTVVTSRSQSGPGDITLSTWYTVREASAAARAARAGSPFDLMHGVGIEVGARLKTPLASKDRCLLTNGATDLSLEATITRPVGAIEPFATLGWTKRGDPQRRDANCRPTGGTVDLRNPLYLGVGFAVPVAPRLAFEAEYEYRQKLRPTSDPKSEVKAGLSYRVSKALSAEGYAITGFSEASPDWGLGARVAYRF